MLSKTGIFLSLGFAVLAGIVKYDHERLLEIPKIGAGLWIMTGGNIPPFVDPTTFVSCSNKESCPWLKSGDVVVTTCTKCGTHWMMTMVHELRTWNLTDLKDFDDILDVVPWAEMKHYPRETREERVDYWGNKWNNTRFPFRAFKAHFDATLLPVLERPDVKFLAGTRNPEDVIVSAYAFFNKFSQESKDLWGNFPHYDFNLDDIVDMFGEKSTSTHFYFKSWYSLRDQPNVLLLHYSDVFKNPRKYIEIVAKFLGLNDITKEALDVVEKRVSIGFMKTKGDKYRYILGRNKDKIFFPDGDAVVNKGGIGVKQKSGDLTEDQKRRVSIASKKFFGENKLLAKIADKGFDDVELIGKI